MVALDFDDMFQEQFPKLVALGVAVVGDREVARELAQETLLRGWSRWESLARYDDPAGWLRRVMTNLAVDHARSHGAQRRALDRVAAGGPPPSSGPVPAPTRWSELVEPLTPLQRVVATLFYAEDLPVAVIAAQLGLAPGTVKSTLSKARRRLQRAHAGGGER